MYCTAVDRSFEFGWSRGGSQCWSSMPGVAGQQPGPYLSAQTSILAFLAEAATRQWAPADENFPFTAAKG
jgi:hypothetical protein